ncbi:MAG: hypothetical protein Q9197_005730 [Variospora fuerteventurae]
MARLNVVVDSDDELPELSTLLAKKTLSDGLQHRQPCQPTSAPTIQRVLPSSSREKKPQPGISAGAPKKQRSLKLEHVDSLRLPLTSLDDLPSGQGPCSAMNLRLSPHKAVRYPPQQKPARASFSEPSNSEDDCSDHMSDFIVSDSESDDVYADISKLLSPTKRVHIPLSPHRPSIDAFWSQEIINEWNDLHSPKKERSDVSKRIIRPLDEDDDHYLSPLEIRPRNSSKSPVKDKQAMEKRRAFSKGKYDLATAFLNELDETITKGEIARLAESTGGVRLIWNKKLQSTAGQAKWKQEVIQSKSPDGFITTKKHRHHASIELAEKVIDDEDRLYNVIAHEYCHLLNFMLSNVRDKPHGKEFKAWAKKCSTAFAHRGVKVVTTHSYEISYKYVWLCNQCGTEYKRHSKSIDPAKHSCGKCKAKLVQMKPVPRAEGKGKGMSEYQKFVKGRFASVKREKPELKMGEIMVVLGKEFRKTKERSKNDLVIVEGGSVEDGDPDDQKDTGFESVVRKLDFLTLASA